MAKLPPPSEGIVLTHFIVSQDVERSRRFYTEVLGARVVFSGKPSGEPINVALSNSFIVISVGGGPTDDKPSVSLEKPRDPDRVSSFLNMRVKDIEAVYAEWTARGANFLTPPKQHQYEIRCYIRDPDGHLIDVGQTTDPDDDWTPAHWPSSTLADLHRSPLPGSVATQRLTAAARASRGKIARHCGIIASRAAHRIAWHWEERQDGTVDAFPSCAAPSLRILTGPGHQPAALRT